MRMPVTVALLTMLSIPTAALAGGTKDGPELQVNTYTTGQQELTRVAMRDDGGFVVVWEDNGSYDIRARRYDAEGNPIGSDFQVQSATAGQEFDPDIASLGPEGFIVVWRVSGDIFARRLDSTGLPEGSDFRVNAYTTGSQAFPFVAGSEDGSFVVTWSDLMQEGAGYGVFARLFDSLGLPLGGDFQVNTWTTGDQLRPSVEVSGSGEFIVAWESEGQDGDDRGVFAQIFEGDGTPSGSEFQVNTYTTFYQYKPSVAADRHGDFLVVWSGVGAQDSSGDGIFGRRLDVTGDFLGPDFKVNSTTIGNQRLLAAAMSNFGEHVVTWSSYGQDGSGWGVFGQRFDRLGDPRGSEFQVNTYTTAHQLIPAVAIDDSGDFVVAWEARDPNHVEIDVAAQRFRGPGPDLTSHVNGDTVDCSDPAISRPTFAWETDGYEQFKVFVGTSSGFEKGTYVTNGDKWLTATTWSPNKKKWRSACNKALAEDPNTPQLHLAIFGKDRDLSSSDPTFRLFGATVEVDVLP